MKYLGYLPTRVNLTQEKVLLPVNVLYITNDLWVFPRGSEGKHDTRLQAAAAARRADQGKLNFATRRWPTASKEGRGCRILFN
jgi:hypothetical protein